jgi:hypothetical protein
VELRVAQEPAEVGVVGADHGGVGGGALPEVEPAVGAGDGAVGVVVAQARQVVDDRRDAAVGVDPEELAAAQRAAGHEEGAVGEVDAVPGRVVARRHDAGAAVGLEAQQTGHRHHLAVGIASLDDVDATLSSKATPVGKVRPVATAAIV